MAKSDQTGWYRVPPWVDTPHQVWGAWGAPRLIFWGFLDFWIFRDFSKLIYKTAVATRQVEVLTWNFWWNQISYRPEGWWKNFWKFWKFLFLIFFKVGFSGWPQLKKLPNQEWKILGIFINHMGRDDVWQNLGFANFGCYLWFFSSKFFWPWLVDFPLFQCGDYIFSKINFGIFLCLDQIILLFQRWKISFAKNFTNSLSPVIRVCPSGMSSIM